MAGFFQNDAACSDVLTLSKYLVVGVVKYRKELAFRGGRLSSSELKSLNSFTIFPLSINIIEDIPISVRASLLRVSAA